MFVTKAALILSLSVYVSLAAKKECDVESAIDLSNQLKGIWQAWLIATAVRFDIAEHLRNGPLTIPELANVTHTDEKGMFRFMRALKYFKIFDKTDDGKWSLTRLSDHLTDDEDCSLKYMANLMVHDEYQIWPNLHKVIETGKPIVPKLYGGDFWKFLGKHPKRFENLEKAAGEILRIFNKDLPKMYDFTPYKHIVDISGNDGTFLTILLKAAPNAHGTIFDYEFAREPAMQYVRRHNVADRVSFFAGDFLETMPEGGDLYVMKQAFHDWDDPYALKILRNVAAQMRKKPAKMLIINQILPDNDDSIPAHVWDLYPFMFCGGKERYRREYEALFKQAGLRLNKVIPSKGTVPDIMEIVLDSRS